MKKARAIYGYIRVSTDEQVKEGKSLQNQREKIEQYAKLHDLTLTEVIEDPAHSAKTLDRPGIQRILSEIHAGTVKMIIVSKLDRLTRRVAHLCQLIELCDECDVALAAVTESIDTTSPTGKMILHFMGSLAQWERETTALRTKESMCAMRDRGERTGQHAQYGYRLSEPGKGGVQIPDEHEQNGIAFARTMRAGGVSLRGIAARLEAAGFLSRTGTRLSAETVRLMVRPTTKRGAA